MKSLEINGKKIVLYSSIKELPIEVSKQFTAYLLQDAGIGSSIEDVDEKFARLFTFLTNDRKEDAIEEVKNLRFSLFSMLAKWDYGALSFACLIKSVDGKEIEDRGIEGLNDLLVKLSDIGLTAEHVKDVVEEVKKNWIRNENYTSQTTSELMPAT